MANVRASGLLFTSEGVNVKRLLIAPGDEVPWHLHTHVRDTFYVVRGPITVFTREPDTTTVLEAGDIFQARAKQPHRVLNASDHEVTALLIQSVADFDFQPCAPV